MNTGELVVLAHEGDLDGARAYENLAAPFKTDRLVLLPLCSERIPPEQVIPPLRLAAHAAKLTVLVVPVLDEKLAGQCDGRCEGGWAGDLPCARCVMERWREVLGGDEVWKGGPTLERLRADEEAESRHAKLHEFARTNRPAFAFKSASRLAVPAAKLKFSGGTAALFLANFLFVQSRKGVPDRDEIAMLAAVKAPPEPRMRGRKPTLIKDNALYTPDWVADYLGIKIGTLNNWISRRKIPHAKIGGKVRFSGKTLRQWIESQTVQPSEDAEPEDPFSKYPWEKNKR